MRFAPFRAPSCPRRSRRCCAARLRLGSALRLGAAVRCCGSRAQHRHRPRALLPPASSPSPRSSPLATNARLPLPCAPLLSHCSGHNAPVHARPAERARAVGWCARDGKGTSLRWITKSKNSATRRDARRAAAENGPARLRARSSTRLAPLRQPSRYRGMVAGRGGGQRSGEG